MIARSLSFHLMESSNSCLTDWTHKVSDVSLPCMYVVCVYVWFFFYFIFHNIYIFTRILVKPLIWVEAVVEPHSNSRIEYMIKTKSQFKSRSIANNVEIIIPVPRDVDTPSFKASIGSLSCRLISIEAYNSCIRIKHFFFRFPYFLIMKWNIEELYLGLTISFIVEEHTLCISLSLFLRHVYTLHLSLLSIYESTYRLLLLKSLYT